jgi:hypothetical protein
VIRLGPIALVALAGCSGQILSDNLEGLSPEEAVAQDLWVSKALPVLEMRCSMCHGGSMPMVAYIAGADDLAKRETLVLYQPRIVNLGAPQSSRILTKGGHEGPALEATEASDILQWIIAESAARPPPPPIRSMQTTPMVCVPPTPCPTNTIDLSSLGVSGSTFTFEVTTLGDGAYLTNMKFNPGATGLYLEHPLLESWPAGATDPKPDPIDRFFAIQLNITAATQLGSGETMAGWISSDPVSIAFDVIEAKRP